MRYFPIFLDLKNQPVLVVGGGPVAARKIRLLLRAGASVRVVAGRLNAGTTRLLRGPGGTWIAREYRPDQVPGNRLVYAATGDAILNRRIFTDAEALGIPVNVVDDPRHCRFITPAIVDRSPLQIAISSSGHAPVLSRSIRGWLEEMLPAGVAEVARAAGRLRPRVNARLEPARRRRFWERLFTRERLLAWSGSETGKIEADIRAALEAPAGVPEPGQVYLVGAGPGRPDLLTVRALQLLGQADVVLHDQLVPGEILELARRDARMINVGKRAGGGRVSQNRINEHMLREARAGRQVVRLKGGDPFVFGRGGEELGYLAARGVRCEVVPGITAANGCAASAGIPLTHRDHSQVLTLVTGHTAAGGAGSIDWAALAGTGRTVAVYMGVKQARRIRRELLAAGIPAALPVALVANGTRADQQVLNGTVSSLPGLARQMRAGSAGLLIIGEVAGRSARSGIRKAANWLRHVA